jgi:hypothetical protein
MDESSTTASIQQRVRGGKKIMKIDETDTCNDFGGEVRSRQSP